MNFETERYRKIYPALSQMVDEIEEQKEIILYGAGNIAQMLAWCLKKCGRKVTKFMVTKRAPSIAKQIEAVSVITLDEAEWDNINVLFIIATKRRVAQLEMIDVLVKRNVCNIFMVNEELENDIKKFFLSGHFHEKDFTYELLDDLEGEPNHYIICCSKKRGYCWRIHKENSLPIKKFKGLWDDDLLSLFEKQYGKYVLLQDIDLMDSKDLPKEYIYAAKSYMDKYISNPSNDPILKYVHAGAALTNQWVSEIRDDTGINISEKNKNYSECTVLYWIWKHVLDVHYIGFCHYRRIFDFPHDSLLCLCGSGIDIVLTTPTICDTEIRDYFVRRYISENDWKFMMEGINKVDEKYYQTALKYEKSHFFSPCNLLIMRKEIFDIYCSFAFGVADYIEKEYFQIGLRRQDRYMGYIFENLLAIFAMYHKNEYFIVYTKMKYLK